MTTIVKAALFAAVAAAFIPSSAAGQGASADGLLRRIDSLERQVVELQRRVAQLESPARVAPARVRASTGDSRDLANWRKLRRGMSMQAVRELLGEPEQVSASSAFTTWDYPNYSNVRFDDDRVAGWSEPRR